VTRTTWTVKEQLSKNNLKIVKKKINPIKMDLSLFLVFSFVCVSHAINCPGCTPLDDLTFDKMINKFPASIVKFDVAYPYGDKHDEFAKVAKDASEMPQLFVGEVGIKDYGDKDNEGLALKFKVKKEDMPTVFIFVKNIEDGSINHHKFSGEFKVENLKNFIRQKSGIHMPLQGCIEEFDKLADKLLKATEDEEKKKIVREAEDEWDKVEGMKGQKRAEVYVKVMRKVVREGAGFVKKEEERVKKLMEGKITKEKKEDMQEKINILRSFTIQDAATKDEL